MKLKESVSSMNSADVSLASTVIHGLLPEKKIDMFHLDTDQLLEKYGDREVERLTNVAKMGDCIWIK